MKTLIKPIIILCIHTFLGLSLLFGNFSETSDYLKNIQTSKIPEVGKEYYLRHNIWHIKGTHITTNYSRGELLPINTKVKLLELSEAKKTTLSTSGPGKKRAQITPAKMTLQVLGSRVIIDVENVGEYTDKDMDGIAQRMLSETPIPLDSVNEDMLKYIKRGMLREGMTKDEVLMARGFPPSHRTPYLDQERWTYWSSRHSSNEIIFIDGRLEQTKSF